MAENIFVKLAKLLVRSQFKKVLDQIGKEIDDDPNIQAQIKDLKIRQDALKNNLEHFCKMYPWHHLCDKEDK